MPSGEHPFDEEIILNKNKNKNKIFTDLVLYNGTKMLIRLGSGNGNVHYYIYELLTI